MGARTSHLRHVGLHRIAPQPVRHKRIWSAAHAAYQQLPAEYRSEMAYPHLPTMLATDPSRGGAFGTDPRGHGPGPPSGTSAISGDPSRTSCSPTTRPCSTPSRQRDPRRHGARRRRRPHRGPPGGQPVHLSCWPRRVEPTRSTRCRWRSGPRRKSGANRPAVGELRVADYLPSVIEQAVYGGDPADPQSGHLTFSPDEVARRGPRFAASVLVRSCDPVPVDAAPARRQVSSRPVSLAGRSCLSLPAAFCAFFHSPTTAMLAGR